MMMPELSLHVLDILQNSIVAGASRVVIEVEVQHAKDWMRVSVEDDACGMDEETLQRVISPFATSRTTRKVGLGIPMFKAGAEAAGGRFEIRSQVGVGTFIQAEYAISNIDRPPLGDMAETILSTVVCNENIDFVYRYKVDEAEFVFDTQEIKAILGEEVPLQSPPVVSWMKEYLDQGIDELNGGV